MQSHSEQDLSPETTHELDVEQDKENQTQRTSTSYAAPTEKTPPVVSNAPKAPDFPDGGLRAWGVVLACFLISCTSYGELNAFGVFQTFYSRDLLQTHSDSAISWIGSVQLMFMFLLGTLVGRAFDIYGSKLLIPGCLLSTFSLIMTSFATKYYQILLAQGVGQGLGIALLSYPAMILPSQWFFRRRAFVTGIVVAGSALSGVIFPIMISRLITEIGFPWTVRTLALLNFVVQAASIPLARKRAPPRMNLPVFDKTIFKDGRFLWHCLSNFFLSFGMFTPSWYIELYSLARGVNPDLALYTISILNAGSVVGRVGTGWVADRLGRLNLLFAMDILAALVCFVIWTNAHNLGAIIAFSILWGIPAGSTQSLGLAGAAQLTSNPANIGARVGTVMTVMAPGFLTGPSLAGAIVGRNGGPLSPHAYLGLQLFTAAMMLAASIPLVLMRIVHGPRSLREKF